MGLMMWSKGDSWIRAASLCLTLVEVSRFTRSCPLHPCNTYTFIHTMYIHRRFTMPDCRYPALQSIHCNPEQITPRKPRVRTVTS
ncbi:hypothetical protein XELAEV_18017792mg [Xenopus laevis]|uniref:Secreted protein n=1 Tax=Xenopus laevis TaxID=8355 RepID=A0A974DC37_XENLA|nr:hypothetical protein XELAEV_18017792mg [Xenopus laevis]